MRPNRQAERSVRGYNRLAPFYRTIELCVFGDVLMRARTSLIGQLRHASSVVVLGDGDGRLLAQLLRQQVGDRFASIDQSAQMLKRQRQKASELECEGCVEFIQADVLALRQPISDCDLIVAAFFLDCFTKSQIEELLPDLLGAVRSGGHLYYVDFVEPAESDSGGTLTNLWNRFLLKMMHWFFGFATGLANRRLVDVPRVIESLGWICVSQRDHNKGWITTRIYERKLC